MIFFKPRSRQAKDHPERDGFAREAMAHMQALYGAAVYMTRNSHEAEDLVQETYLKAHRFWDRYQPGTNCKAWLFRIMTNTFINRNRKKTRSFALLDEVDTDEAAPALYEGSSFYSTPEKAYLGRLMPDEVKAAIEALPESFRVPVVLADLQDFSYKEIAEITDCPVGTVMSRLHRGRKRLQEVLFGRAIATGVIAEKDARAEDGAVSLEAYRARKKAAGSR